MKRPTTLRVFGKSVTITWDDASKFENPDEYAKSNSSDRTIFLHPVKCADVREAESTLLHELMHMALGLAGQSEPLAENQEEGLVIALENGLYPVICDLVKLGYFRTKEK